MGIMENRRSHPGMTKEEKQQYHQKIDSLVFNRIKKGRTLYFTDIYHGYISLYWEEEIRSSITRLLRAKKITSTRTDGPKSVCLYEVKR